MSARVFAAQSLDAESDSMFEDAIMRAGDLNHRTRLWQLHADYSRILAERGSAKPSSLHVEKAHGILFDILSQFTDSSNTESYLSSSRVSWILAEVKSIQNMATE